MAPNKEAQHANRENRKDHRAITKDGFARKRRKNMRCRSHPRQNRDVNFWVAKEPEEVLPKKRRATVVQWLQLTTDVKVSRNKETGSGNSIQQQQDAAAEQHWKRKQRQHGGCEPCPASQW